MVNNIFHFTKTNLTASQTYPFPITEDIKRQVDNKAFNWLVCYNGTGNLILLQLNNSTNERIPIPASGGRVVINKDDVIHFQSVEVIETTASGASGTIYLTVGAL